MERVTLADAKEHLEELVHRATRGEDVCIDVPPLGAVRLIPVRGPDPAAPRITDLLPPFSPLKEPRKPGRLAGQMKVPAKLMEPMSEEELNDWYGGGS